MSDDLLSKLMAAESDEERDWLVMQFSLDNLAPEAREAVWAAAIPHWFDLNFLAALLDKTESETVPIFEQLPALSFVEPFQDRGYNIHERSRALLLKRLWQTDQPRYRQFAQRAADHCANQDQSSAEWRIEHIYHLLIADPDRGLSEFVNTGWNWHNAPNFAYAKVEAMVMVARELADAGRLADRGLAWTQFWEGLLDCDYSRYQSAKTKLLSIKITPAEDGLLTGAISQRLGAVLLLLGERDQARRQYEAAIALSQQIGDRLGEANSIRGLGDIHLHLSQYDQARGRYEAAIALYQRIGDRLGEANCIQRMGDIHIHLSQYDQARGRYEAAIPIYQQIGDRLGEANCIKGLGDIHLRLGQYDQARGRYEAAIPIYQQVGARLGEANCIQGLGDIHLRLSQYDQARGQYEAAIALSQQIGDRLGEANSIKGLGDIHLHLSQYDQARGRYEAAISIYRQIGDRNDEGVCHAGMAACYRKLGMVNEYSRHAALARELMTNESVYNSACLASVCGDVDEALTLLRSALEKREVGIAWVRKDPDFEWVRDDPRFAQLLDEMAAQQT